METARVPRIKSLPASAAAALPVYNQPLGSLGTLYHSSLWDPVGGNYNQYVFDDFTLPAPQDISEITWYGGFDPVYAGSGGPVADFQVGIYPTAPGMSPDLSKGPLVEYMTGGNAGQTAVGTFGGNLIYRYGFALPVSFHAAAGTRYWIQIEAFQHGLPDWCIAAGTGGDGYYFRRISDAFVQTLPGDAAFALLATPTLPFKLHLPIIFK
jgi:hypothetical protein